MKIQRTNQRTNMTRFSVLALALLAAACIDGIGPDGQGEIPLALSLQAAAGITSAEGDALGAAFDQVNNFHITVLDSLTRTVYVDTIISVIPGAAEHVLVIDLPEEALGALLLVHVTAFVDSVELFTTTATATVNEESEQITVEASVRYTGPGIRGSVNDSDGRGIGGVIVTLLQGGQPIEEVATAAGGSFLFAGLSAGEYVVRPTPTSGLTAGPAERSPPAVEW